MNPAELKRWKELEFSARRSGALHPDDCPKLTIKRVEWAIPPRGERVIPKFGPNGPELVSGKEKWPEAQKLVEVAPLREKARCDKCGQVLSADLSAEAARAEEFLLACFALVGKLLDEQYTLSAEQKGQLLGFEADQVPDWIVCLLDWAVGSSGQEDSTLPVSIGAETGSAQRPWWKFWKR